MSVESRNAIRAALQPHADRMAPMAFEDAIKLWGDEFAGLNEGQVKELVDARINQDRYKHFLARPGQSVASATTDRPAAASGQAPPPSAPGVFYSSVTGQTYHGLTEAQIRRASEFEDKQQAFTQRFVEGVKQAQTAGRTGHAVGLRGEWAGGNS